MAEGVSVVFAEMRECDIEKYFRNVRVDHLSEDELDYELDVRGVMSVPNDTMSRKRRSLRERLKQEKEENFPNVKTLNREPLEELAICELKLKEIEEVLVNTPKVVPPRCQSSLLHLGCRVKLLKNYVGEGEMRKLDQLLLKVLFHLNTYFYGKSPIQFQEPDLGGLDELVENPNLEFQQNEGGTNTQQGDKLTKDDKDILDSLTRLGLLGQDKSDVSSIKEALSALEQEVYQLRRFQHYHIQALSRPVSVSDTIQNQPTTYSGTVPKNSVSFPSAILPVPSCSVPAPMIRTTTTLTMSNAYPRVATSVSCFPSSVFNFVTTARQSVSAINPPLYTSVTSSIFDANSIPRTLSDQWNEPRVTRTVPAPISNWSYGPNPYHSTIPSYPTAVSGYEALPNPAFHTHYPTYDRIPLSVPMQISPQTARGNFNRQSLPVSKWKLDKYAGNDQGLKLNEFLVLVSQLALSEHTSEEELFDSAFHLFTGPALNWYMVMRSSGRLLCWSHLVDELRKTFAHPELDSMLRSKVSQRRQQRNETFQEFYYDMESMFRSMINPMSDWEKLNLLKSNLRVDYKKALLWKPISSLPELIEAGHKIDASTFSLYSKLANTEKATHAITETKFTKNETKGGNGKPAFKFQEPNNVYKGKETQFKRKDSATENKRLTRDEIPGQAQSSSKFDPQEGPSKLTRTLETLLAAHRPPRSYECLNCRQPNHGLEQCRNYRGLLCLVCGFKGFETQHCPYCRKNGLQTIENRRPSPNNA